MTKFTSYTMALCVIACLASASILAAEPLSAVDEELIVWEAQERALVNPLASGGNWYE